MAGLDVIDQGLPWLARNISAALERFDPASGRFMTGTGWAVTNQDLLLSMAFLYRTEHPGNPFCRDTGFLEVIGRAGDALRDFQYPDGTVEFVKVDGSRWGPIYMPWSMYHWLETYALLRDALESERLARWEAGLRLAFAGIDREMRERLERAPAGGPGARTSETVVHNIPTWDAMSLHRAAGVFDQPAWQATAERMLGLTLAAQQPDGYWPEFAGPTVSYNLVYVHALGLYHLQGGTLDVLPALERALRFHEVFTYPDGTLVETVDGRVKYHRHIGPSGLVAFSLLPRGRSFAAAQVRRAIARGEAWTEPHFAQLLRYWPAGETTEPAPNLVEPERVTTVRCRALVIREQSWYVCLSGLTRPPTDSRWGQDRQSFLGVWHEGTGLIVGGGNSKDQPEWSTFLVQTADGGHCYVPERGSVDERERSLTLVCADRELRVRVAALAPGQLTLHFRAQGPPDDRLIAHLPLQLHPGSRLETSFAGGREVANGALTLVAGEGPQHLRCGAWRVGLDGPFRLDWPSFPFNPYAKDGKSNPSAPDGARDLTSAVAILTVPLVSGVPRAVRITIEPAARPTP